MQKIKTTRSTGNVFLDLGLPRAEAARLLIRADLLIEIERVVKARRLTGQALTTSLGLSRERVNELRRGRLRRFSTDALLDMLSRLGVHVRLVVRSTTQRSVATQSVRAKALGRLRRMRRPLPSGFAFNREAANSR